MSQLLRLACAAVLAAAIAGCANAPKAKGIPWWPQGPGNAEADVPRTSAVADDTNSRSCSVTLPDGTRIAITVIADK